MLQRLMTRRSTSVMPGPDEIQSESVVAFDGTLEMSWSRLQMIACVAPSWSRHPSSTSRSMNNGCETTLLGIFEGLVFVAIFSLFTRDWVDCAVDFVPFRLKRPPALLMVARTFASIWLLSAFASRNSPVRREIRHLLPRLKTETCGSSGPSASAANLHLPPRLSEGFRQR